MRLPTIPPETSNFMTQLALDSDKLLKVFMAISGPLVNQKYLHWDKLIHLTPPFGLTHKEWWFGLKFTRERLEKKLPLKDATDCAFRYLEPDPVSQWLHEIDLEAGGSIGMPMEIRNSESKDQYLVRSLIEEAVNSSQLEGATTTLREAKAMIRSGRDPVDRSEQMILNNYRTMQAINKLKNEPLTRKLVFKLHRLITEDTLDNTSDAGRLRHANENVRVHAVENGTVLYTPPPAEMLDEYIDAMCFFANNGIPDRFMHPVLQSIILHFWLAYAHPFIDGNGRTARALFYWSMFKHGFWLFEYISISGAIKNSPGQYRSAFLYTETDNNDLTYFILYHLKIIKRALRDLYAYIQRKTKEVRVLVSKLKETVVFNHRQRALLGHALRHPHQRYTVNSHRVSHKIAPQTARTDLNKLVRKGLLISKKIGRQYIFTPARDFEDKLASLRD